MKYFVTFNKGITDDLLRCGLWIFVPSKGGRWIIVQDGEQQLTRLADGAVLAKPIRASDHSLVLHVKSREFDLHEFESKQTLSSTRALSILGAAVVDKSCVSFGRTIEFSNLWDVESRLESIPDVWAKSVSDGDAYLVLLIELVGGRGEQVAAEFANVLNDGHLVLCTILEELLGSKLLSKDNRATTVHHHSDAQTTSCTVEQGQHSVHDV